jgi:hypothetical protein
MPVKSIPFQHSVNIRFISPGQASEDLTISVATIHIGRVVIIVEVVVFTVTVVAVAVVPPFCR